MDVVAEFQRSGEIVTPLTHEDLDISSASEVSDALTAIRPSTIVNTAAMHHVEKCEQEPLRAYEVNALGVRNLSNTARTLGAKFVHVSTDYVFNGTKSTPYSETDQPAPLNVYGNSKLAGEAFIQGTGEKYFIVRTSGLYGKNPCRAKGGRNFVETMLKLAGERDTLRVVDDEWVSPTSTVELARQIALLSRTEEFGLYHATSEGSCSWYEFAKTIFELMKIRTNLEIASASEFPAKVPRPKYSVLENAALKRRGLNSFRRWQDGLEDYLLQPVSRSASH
jgi:dTDP-4-dehydrorhamnose reductase